MTTLSLVKLSGSTDSKSIKVAATASPGTLIHTANATGIDKIWLYADNDSASPVTLTIEWGGTTDIDHTIKVTIPAKGSLGSDGVNIVIPGFLLSNALVVRAYTSVANVIKINGEVHRSV